MNFFKPLVLTGVLAILASCAKSDVNQNNEDFANPKSVQDESSLNEDNLNKAGLKNVLSSAESLSKAEAIPDRVGFSFDSYSLSADQRKILDSQLIYIKKQSSIIKKISISGYADERGSIDYNLALGSRRAEAVKKHFVSNGISSTMIETISYGKNIVLVEGHDEAAYKENRVSKVKLCETVNCQ